MFEVFNNCYKDKALPYKFVIAQIANLLNIDHKINIKKLKRDQELWAEFLATNPFEQLQKKNELERYIEDQISLYTTTWIIGSKQVNLTNMC